MKNYKERLLEANGIYQQGMENVKNKPVPKGQKYLPGTRVKIKNDLGESMSHFPSGKFATVRYTYAHAYGGDNIKSYCLDVDDIGEISWYYEHQIELPEKHE